MVIFSHLVGLWFVKGMDIRLLNIRPLTKSGMTGG